MTDETVGAIIPHSPSIRDDLGSERPDERLRRILERESAARLAWKRAKAKAFLASMGETDMTYNKALQRVYADAELQRLEDDYERARIDLIVENALNWGKLYTDGPSEAEQRGEMFTS